MLDSDVLSKNWEEIWVVMGPILIQLKGAKTGPFQSSEKSVRDHKNISEDFTNCNFTNYF